MIYLLSLKTAMLYKNCKLLKILKIKHCILYIYYLRYTIFFAYLYLLQALFLGLVASTLIEKYGDRKVAIVASSLTVTGLLSSLFASNVYVLYLTYGAITGICPKLPEYVF